MEEGNAANLGTASLLNTVETFLSAQNEDALIISDIHLDMARFYIHSGNEAKGREHLAKVKFNSDKVDLLQPYVGIILEAASNNDDKSIFRIVEEHKNIFNYINSIQYKKGQYGNHDPKQDYVDKILCQFAAKAFALDRKHEQLAKLTAIPHCTDPLQNFSISSLTSYLVNHKYKAAYEYIDSQEEAKPEKHADKADGWKLNKSVRLFKECLDEKEINSSEISDEDRVFLLEQAKRQHEAFEDNKAYFLSVLLRKSGEVEEAYGLAKELSDPYLRREALLRVYDEFYLQGDRERVMELAELLYISKAPPQDYKSFGVGGRGQWYVGHMPEAAVLFQKPTPLAYEIAMSMTDDKTRFKALLGIFTSSSKTEPVNVPECSDTEYACVRKELVEIANGQESVFDHDYMYSRIVELDKKAGNVEAAEQAYKEIKDPDGKICHYDVCRHGLIESPVPDSPSCAVKLPQTLSGLDKKQITEVAECHHKTGLYKGFVESITKPQKTFFGFLTKNQKPVSQEENEYFIGLAYNLKSEHDYENFFYIASLITDPEMRKRVLRSSWGSLTPHTLLNHDEVLTPEKSAERVSSMEDIINALLSSPLKDDDSVWMMMLEDTEFTYWNGFELREDMTVEQEELQRQEIWGIVQKIEKMKPHLKVSHCSPRRFNDFGNQCEVQRFLAKKQYEEAMDAASAEDKPLVARLILIELFTFNNKNFRDSENSGFRFGAIYNAGKECSLD